MQTFKLNIKSSLFIFTFLFILLVNGILPFISIPSLPIPLWATGFAESFSHGHFFNVYASDFGYPQPAAIAFGLSAAWPMSLLIRMGLHGADAYSCIFALWLLVAFISCIKLAKQQKLPFTLAVLLGCAWLTMPTVWVHSQFSMLQLGIALLPFYFLIFLKFINSNTNKQFFYNSVYILISTIIAIFMDGYSFVFYLTGSFFLLSYKIIFEKSLFKFKIILLTVYFFAIILSYFLYKIYFGKTVFSLGHLDFFRGWALDPIFAIIPTKGTHWLADLLHLSAIRNSSIYYGDWSVWTATFMLPIFVLGIGAWLFNTHKTGFINIIFFIFLFSLYMSLGPTLKFNTTKQAIEVKDGYESLMKEEFGLISTGNGFLSSKLPGLREMRASYRWTALAVFALWWIILLSFNISKKYNNFLVVGLLLVLVFNLPDIPKKIKQSILFRKDFISLDHTIIKELKDYIAPKNVVLIIPSTNDFFINYVIAKSGLKSFNIAGDKNIIAAQDHWPEEVLLGSEPVSSQYLWPQIKLLASGHVDTLIVPYSSFLRTNPCIKPFALANSCKNYTPEVFEFYKQVKFLKYLKLTESNSFFTLELTDAFKGKQHQDQLLSILLHDISFPIITNKQSQINPYILNTGWYSSEETLTWSQKNATLNLLSPQHCVNANCSFKITFQSINTRPQVLIKNNNKSINPSNLTAFPNNTFEFIIPIDSLNRVQHISIQIANAASPNSFDKNNYDLRILGIALAKIELIQN